MRDFDFDNIRIDYTPADYAPRKSSVKRKCERCGHSLAAMNGDTLCFVCQRKKEESEFKQKALGSGIRKELLPASSPQAIPLPRRMQKKKRTAPRKSVQHPGVGRGMNGRTPDEKIYQVLHYLQLRIPRKEICFMTGLTYSVVSKIATGELQPLKTREDTPTAPAPAKGRDVCYVNITRLGNTDRVSKGELYGSRDGRSL